MRVVVHPVGFLASFLFPEVQPTPNLVLNQVLIRQPCLQLWYKLQLVTPQPIFTRSIWCCFTSGWICACVSHLQLHLRKQPCSIASSCVPEGGEGWGVKKKGCSSEETCPGFVFYLFLFFCSENVWKATAMQLNPPVSLVLHQPSEKLGSQAPASWPLLQCVAAA